MKAPHRSELEREVLPAQVGERLLARAAELDAALKGGTELAKLRAAALEAGISPHAFDTALEELRAADPVPVAEPRRRRPKMAVFLVGVCFFLLAGTMVTRVVVPVAAAPMVQEAFLLRCLPPGEAIELLRAPLDGATTVSMSVPSDAPRVLRVRASPEQMSIVRALLEREDGAACATPRPRR